MRRIDSLLFVGLLMALTLAGCGSGSTGASNLPTTTGVATDTAMTPSPSSYPAATTPSAHSPTRTPTPASTTRKCGQITAKTSGSSTTTVPSNPQPLEDCFTTAFMKCQSATLAITFIDSTGKTGDSLRTPPSQGDCDVAAVDETKYAPNGGVISSTSFTCAALVPSGEKYSLRVCADNKGVLNNEWIIFP